MWSESVCSGKILAYSTKHKRKSLNNIGLTHNMFFNRADLARVSFALHTCQLTVTKPRFHGAVYKPYRYGEVLCLLRKSPTYTALKSRVNVDHD